MTRTLSTLASAAMIGALCLGTAGSAEAALADIIGTNDSDLLDGTAGDDTIRGLGGGDQLNGFSGEDLLIAGGGGDGMEGGTGADVLRAGPGHDTLWGRLGPDALYGGGGFDVLTGGLQRDQMYAGAGDDTLVLTVLGEDNGRDYANCGTGRDTVYVEAHSNDDIAASCEVIRIVR